MGLWNTTLIYDSFSQYSSAIARATPAGRGRIAKLSCVHTATLRAATVHAAVDGRGRIAIL